MSDTPPRITRAQKLKPSPISTTTSKPEAVKAEDKAPAPDGDTPMSEPTPAPAPEDVTAAAAQTGSGTVTTEKKVEEKEDDFADLFNDLAIKEEDDDDDYSQVLARNYVTWGRFDKKQTEKASALMKSTLIKMGRKGIDYCKFTKKWFFTNEMWAAASAQKAMKEYGWRAYELTEDDKALLKAALANGEIKNLHVK